MTDLRQQAEALYGREQEELRRREQREREAQKEQGIRGHIGRIQQQRDDERKEQARKEAAAEAEELAAELHHRGEMLQDHAEGMRSMIKDYAELRDRLLDARRRAGRDVGGWEARPSTLLAPWFRSIFGGHGSLVDIPSEQAGQVRTPNQAPRTLPERDALAAPLTNQDSK